MPKKYFSTVTYLKKNTGSDNYVYARANKAYFCTRLKMQFRKTLSIPNDRPLPCEYITVFGFGVSHLVTLISKLFPIDFTCTYACILI